jgi:putative molybdopterin biosynthesis protein
MSLSPLYTPQEVADLWKVTRRTVYEWIKDGRLKACKIGDTVRIAEADLKAFVQPIQLQSSPRPKATKVTSKRL